jgi:hypothetical protein
VNSFTLKIKKNVFLAALVGSHVFFRRRPTDIREIYNKIRGEKQALILPKDMKLLSLGKRAYIRLIF